MGLVLQALETQPPAEGVATPQSGPVGLEGAKGRGFPG